MGKAGPNCRWQIFNAQLSINAFELFRVLKTALVEKALAKPEGIFARTLSLGIDDVDEAFRLP